MLLRIDYFVSCFYSNLFVSEYVGNSEIYSNVLIGGDDLRHCVTDLSVCLYGNVYVAGKRVALDIFSRAASRDLRFLGNVVNEVVNV